MYEKYLDAFIAAADCGSMTKAAETLFISPTAVMKQINQLEKSSGIILFTRSNKGLILTEAGKSVYEDAKYIINYSQKALMRAKQIINTNSYYIRIGTSLMNPSTEIAALLQTASINDSKLNFHIVAFDDYRNNYTNILNHLGEKIDIIAGIYFFSKWTNNLHNVLHLRKEPLCIAVAPQHRLANKSELSLEQLNGETIALTKPGESAILDDLRQNILNNYPKIKLLNLDAYDVNIFNQCAASNTILLTTAIWSPIHPMLKTLSLNWQYALDYGIIYPLNPSEGVKKFIKLAAKYADTSSDKTIFRQKRKGLAAF